MEKYMNNTTVGVDLAKDVIQTRALSQQKIISNTEMNVNDFALWFTKLGLSLNLDIYGHSL